MLGCGEFAHLETLSLEDRLELVRCWQNKLNNKSGGTSIALTEQARRRDVSYVEDNLSRHLQNMPRLAGFGGSNQTRQGLDAWMKSGGGGRPAHVSTRAVRNKLTKRLPSSF